MFIPSNATQSVADIIASSSSVILADRAEHCDTIGHCRTVWNIIWSCLITIFACTWVVVHPNIPQPKTPFRRARRHAPRIWSWAWVFYPARSLGISLYDLFRRQFPDMLSSLREKLGIALLALLAPEFILVRALRQWLRARTIAEECREAVADRRQADRDKTRAEKGRPESADIHEPNEQVQNLGSLGISVVPNVEGLEPVSLEEAEDEPGESYFDAFPITLLISSP